MGFVMQVKVGQVWESRDARDFNAGHGGRQFRVTAITGNHAVVFNLHSRRHSKIRLDRFRGTDAKGYRLVKDIEAQTTGEAVTEMLNMAIERAMG